MIYTFGEDGGEPLSIVCETKRFIFVVNLRYARVRVCEGVLCMYGGCYFIRSRLRGMYTAMCRCMKAMYGIGMVRVSVRIL